MMAFSNAFSVRMSDGFNPSLANPNARSPARCVICFKAGRCVGIKADPGRAMPNASAMICIVEAVPMNEQAPQVGHASRL